MVARNKRSAIREDDGAIRLINTCSDINDVLIARDGRDLTERLSALLVPDTACHARV